MTEPGVQPDSSAAGALSWAYVQAWPVAVSARFQLLTGGARASVLCGCRAVVSLSEFTKLVVEGAGGRSVDGGVPVSDAVDGASVLQAHPG